MSTDPKTDFPAWCREHAACTEGQELADTCPTLADFWRRCQRADWMLWVDVRDNILTDQQRRQFAVWCARQVQHLMTDPRSVAALDVAERHARGEATDEELARAARAAWAASADSATWAASDASDAWAARAAWAASDARADSADSSALQADHLRTLVTP